MTFMNLFPSTIFFFQVYVTGEVDEMVFLLPVTVVVQATQYDNMDRSIMTTLKIELGNMTVPVPELQFVDTDFSANILETFPVGNPVINLG